jgi:hypothetical protein
MKIVCYTLNFYNFIYSLDKMITRSASNQKKSIEKTNDENNLLASGSSTKRNTPNLKIQTITKRRRSTSGESVIYISDTASSSNSNNSSPEYVTSNKTPNLKIQTLTRRSRATSEESVIYISDTASSSNSNSSSPEYVSLSKKK